MNGRRMFGVETEYAVTVLDAGGEAVAREPYVERLMHQACTRVPHVTGHRPFDAFLQNGSRLYVDVGHHPELGGPECVHPWDVVRYAKAGDVLLADLAERVRAEDTRLGQILIFKHNVDYSGSGATWGSHENYLHRADVNVLHQRLIPHLVSRVIYTGAGGFNAQSPGLEFLLSPRAMHITEAISPESTSARGIIHTRDESLSARGYRRQHLICGESLRSDLAAWLRVGVTAIIVALVEAGVAWREDVQLEAPVDALRTFSRDPTGRAVAKTRGAGWRTAIEIQRWYLDHAFDHLDHPCMPSWAPEVCRRWADILERLQRGLPAVAGTLDWAIKLRLYQMRAKRHGIPWSRLPAWTGVLEQVRRIQRRHAVPLISPGPLTSAGLLAPDGPMHAEMRALTPYLEAQELRWDEFDAVVALRQELLEIDTRFGQIGAGSLFASLEAAGILDHRVEGVDRIAEAVEAPPLEGRAHVRGNVIRRASLDGRVLSCGWSFVTDPAACLRLDLSDPFTQDEVWTSIAPQAAQEETSLFAALLRRRRAGDGA
jgi:proteasome accessory factor A